MKKIKTEYELRTAIKVVATYQDENWAKHSAECWGLFLGVPVEVVDKINGIVIFVFDPKLRKEQESERNFSYQRH